MSANQYGEAAAKLNEYGIDTICQDILNGVTLTNIARALEVSIGSLISWRDADPERSARAREARARRAEMWDELAITELRAAKDPISLGIAKEIAHHYRWRASKTAPAEYGDKVQHANAAGDGDLTIQVVKFGGHSAS